ncbi:hypothetical protein SAICODRAFT_8762 [Saitoella complicata NRRL Y-17804]|uniref:uncharacterized protein n=1 Tax=Saitoella complicata (strain BCRC 22490 / CBS 7301 / JCM 7358 / NBRC 10748 / NRRL Y-17804) TaxID=698492 RepID=UPI0008673D74|nr:uncharacterized protein SAICODRAFT_8762 [Saitoella complicata NRRL Y-17804]ODQ51830.1 hypothetical protein SAICODRAFT_8762 [Saitoella complicata NRRL Y-17804]
MALDATIFAPTTHPTIPPPKSTLHTRKYLEMAAYLPTGLEERATPLPVYAPSFDSRNEITLSPSRSLHHFISPSPHQGLSPSSATADAGPGPVRSMSTLRLARHESIAAPLGSPRKRREEQDLRVWERDARMSNSHEGEHIRQMRRRSMVRAKKPGTQTRASTSPTKSVRDSKVSELDEEEEGKRESTVSGLSVEKEMELQRLSTTSGSSTSLSYPPQARALAPRSLNITVPKRTETGTPAVSTVGFEAVVFDGNASPRRRRTGRLRLVNVESSSGVASDCDDGASSLGATPNEEGEGRLVEASHARSVSDATITAKSTGHGFRGSIVPRISFTEPEDGEGDGVESPLASSVYPPTPFSATFGASFRDEEEEGEGGRSPVFEYPEFDRAGAELVAEYTIQAGTPDGEVHAPILKRLSAGNGRESIRDQHKSLERAKTPSLLDLELELPKFLTPLPLTTGSFLAGTNTTPEIDRTQTKTPSLAEIQSFLSLAAEKLGIGPLTPEERRVSRMEEFEALGVEIENDTRFAEVEQEEDVRQEGEVTEKEKERVRSWDADPFQYDVDQRFSTLKLDKEVTWEEVTREEGKLEPLRQDSGYATAHTSPIDERPTPTPANVPRASMAANSTAASRCPSALSVFTPVQELLPRLTTKDPVPDRAAMLEKNHATLRPGDEKLRWGRLRRQGHSRSRSDIPNLSELGIARRKPQGPRVFGGSVDMSMGMRSRLAGEGSGEGETVNRGSVSSRGSSAVREGWI